MREIDSPTVWRAKFSKFLGTHLSGRSSFGRMPYSLGVVAIPRPQEGHKNVGAGALCVPECGPGGGRMSR